MPFAQGYTTHPVKSSNIRLRKVFETHAAFPEGGEFKVLYSTLLRQKVDVADTSLKSGDASFFDHLDYFSYSRK